MMNFDSIIFPPCHSPIIKNQNGRIQYREMGKEAIDMKSVYNISLYLCLENLDRYCFNMKTLHEISRFHVSAHKR